MNIHKSIVALLLTICWSALSYGQDCVSFTGPITLPERIDTLFTFPVYNLDSTDLATNQRVCRVNIDFATEYPEDMLFAIISPNGEELVLTGQTGVRSGSAVPFTNWDISFVPLSVTPAPDLGYDNDWKNGNLWFFNETYTGSYWPYDGADLDNLRTGTAFGEWKLRVIDFLDLHAVTINSFSIEFCNPTGIDCKECIAEADTLNPTTINYCENDPDKCLKFSDYLRDTAHIDNLAADFIYNAVIVQNDTVIDFRSPTINDSISFNGLTPGSYDVYGMVYDTLYKMDVPDPDSTFTIDSLRNMMDSLPRIFCGDLTMDALTIVIDPIDTTYVTETICNGDSLVVGDSTFVATTQTEVILTNQYDCDSIIIIDLEVIKIPLTVIDTILCYGDSLQFDGAWYTQMTNELFQFTSSIQECDSIVFLNLRFHPYNFREIDAEICGGDVYPFFGVDRDSTGVYRGSLIDQNGCDSVVQLNLNVVTQFVVDTVATLCLGDTFFIGAEKFFSSGTYSDTIPSSLFCDSIINLDLTIVDPIRSDVSEIICFGDSILLGDQYYNVTGEYIDTLRSSIGCDSIVTLELIVRPQNESITTELICFGDSIQSAGKFYNSEGIYRDTLPGRFLCDSIIILDLTVREENRVAISDMVCFGQSVSVGDSIYNRTGTFETVLRDMNNCDSIVTLDLVIMDQVISILDSTICRGDSILVGDEYFNETGNYEVVIQRPGGCDSTVIINLDIIQPIISVLPVRLCEGLSYTLGTQSFNIEGVYRDTLQSVVTGCDSIVILDLQYDPVSLIETFEFKCTGDSSFFDNRWIKETGIYDDTLRTVANCDSIDRLHLTFLSLDNPVMITEVLCFGDSLLFDGGYLKENGVYRDTLVSAQLCDSLVILDLSFRGEQRFTESMTICHGDTVMFQNTVFTETGQYSFKYTDIAGCDSTVVLDLVVEECPLEITILSSNPSCDGMANGSIRIGLDYGNPLYTIRIYNDDFPFAFGDIFVFGDTLLFDNLSADGYTIEIEYETLSDIRRDTFIDVTLTNESGITINTTALSSPACIDDSNGMIINEISGGLEPYRYLWNDGSEELIRTGLSAGDYQLIVIDDRSCRDTFNFEMVNPDPIVFEIDRTPPSCFGASDGELRFINIMGGTGDYGYNIGFGEQASPIFSNLGSGNYILSVEDSNGCIVDGLETISDPSVFSINLGDDITVDNIGEVQLGLTSNAPMTNISWLPDDNLSCSDCPNPIASITNTVSYQVTANSESGCTAADQITVILDIDRTVDPAQAFTPNGDGVNDIFIVHGNNSIAEISNIEIYARSGELVWKQESFPINDPNFGWDGTYQGEPMTSQILGYFIEVLYTDGKARIFKGQLALIR